MYSDSKAVAVGDLVTVIVQESASVSSNKSTSSEKSSTTDDQLNRLLFSAEAFGAGGPPLSKGGELPGLGWSSSRSFEGSGSVSDQQSVQSRLSAVVIDRLPNGNLVIEGIRKVSFTNERNFVVLRGMIRPQDVLADNTILSSRVADAEIELVAEGSLSEDQRQGWLNRLYGWLNPF
jgi:flagellar L-ring protein precursor FlgH